MSWDKSYTTFEDVLNGEEEFIHCKGEKVESMHTDLCTDVSKGRKRRTFSPDCCRISRGGKMQGHLFKVRINKGNGTDLQIKATWSRWGRCFQWAHVTKIPNSMRMHWGVLEIHLRSDQSAACCWIVSQQAVKGLSKGRAENLTSLQSILDKHVRWRQGNRGHSRLIAVTEVGLNLDKERCHHIYCWRSQGPWVLRAMLSNWT